VADWDGQNVQTALNAGEPIISPAWSPDGKRLAYVSFETKKPVVYVHDLASGQRKAVAKFKGSNSAPAWSHDGRSLAVTLTRDGGSQIYQVSADGGESARRLTQSSSIDTEPVYSPDGKFLYFTSDRGGAPQIYRMPSNGGAASRVTFGSSYNVSPRISPDGQQMAYVTQRNGRFLIALKDLQSGDETLLTDTGEEESPSFAPNGQWVMYTTRAGGHEYLMAVSTDGRVKQRLSSSTSSVREPAWGPYTW
jgi:tol-pal system beta propeller repeat protein tolB